MTTPVKSDFIQLDSDRTLEEKLRDIVNASDYGASYANSASSNTTSIQNAINAVAGVSYGGFVLISPGTSYTESSLTIPDDVLLLEFTENGTMRVISKDQGTTLPVTKGGLVLKSKGNTGILLRALDYGVTAEPIFQILDETNGDIAAVHTKFIEMDEVSAPAAPSANKVRMYTRDNGSGKTQIVAQFPTGAVQVIATEP